MDVDQYVAARYGRLLELAVELGCPEQDAERVVDQVLTEQRRRIQKATDPDPLVREALLHALRGEPSSTRPPWLRVAVGSGVLVAVIITAIVSGSLLRGGPSAAVPSLFGYDAGLASEVLREAGLEVSLEPTPACEPRGLVVSTDPPAGDLAVRGAPVTVRTALPLGPFCEAEYPFRVAAWSFIDFARGGPAPEFAETVYVVVDGAAPAAMTSGDAADRRRWGETLRLVADPAGAPGVTETGMPRLTVRSGIPPLRQCGVARPMLGEGRSALRLQIDPGPDGSAASRCPLTVDLFRVGQVIDAVVVYTGLSDMR
jgi:hypothetical protein